MMTAPELGDLAWRKSSFSNGANACVEVAWHKSTYSNGGSACVEVGWHKSSFSSNGDACVEVAARGESAAVRDSKATDGPTLAFPTTHWRSFLNTLS